MTDQQLIKVNNALSLQLGGMKLNKDKTYRPYCLVLGCNTLNRMELKSYGFQCVDCQNNIDFDLRHIDDHRQ